MSAFRLNPSAPMGPDLCHRASDERGRHCIDRTVAYVRGPFTPGLWWSSSRGLGAGLAGPLGSDSVDGGNPWGVELLDDGGVRSTFKYAGVAKDSGGNTVTNAIITPYLTATDAVVGPDVLSNVVGEFEACSQYSGQDHFLVAYKVGTPDISGTTKNNLRFT